MNKWLSAILVSLSLPVTLMGITKSAVVQEKHDFFTSAEYSYYGSEHIWNKKGEKKPAHDDFILNGVEAYFEYGLTDEDTLVATVGWGHIHETLNGGTKGYNDLILGWKRHIGEVWCHVLALELDAIIPLEKDYEPGLCYSRYGAELNALASKSFFLWDTYAWYDLRLGYLWYSGFPSDQILADASINFHPMPRVFIKVGGFLEYGLFNGHSRNDRSLFFYNPNYRLLTGEVEITVCLNRGISFVAGYDRFVWGENVGYGGRFYAGTQYQF